MLYGQTGVSAQSVATLGEGPQEKGLLVMLGILTLLAGTSSSLEAQRGAPFPRIANCYAVQLTPDSSEGDLDEIAQWDLLIGGVWANWADADSTRRIQEKTQAVRARNPHIIILDFSSSAPYADPNDKSFPATGWLLQPDGQRVEGWPGTQMTNLTRTEVIDWLVARSVASVRERGFDGTFIDCMGSGFDWWACNIESGGLYEIDADEDGKADDRQWLDRTWVEQKTELARRVREALGPEVPFMTNQAGDWGLPHMNGILLEDYLDYVLDGNWTWERVMGDYLHWARDPQPPCLTTIVSSSGVQPPFDPWRTLNQEARDAILEHGRGLLPRMRFGLATTLMGDGYFAYDLHTRWRGQRWWYPEYDAPLGYPKGAAAEQPDGTWRREFDGGTVIVNPTLFDAPVNFEERREDVSSGKVAAEFIIPPRDGRLLLPTEKLLAPGTMPDPAPLFTINGSEPFIERDGQILWRLEGQAALFDAQGRLLRITDGTRTLVEGVKAFIVKDNRWQDFAYGDCAHRRLPEGGLEFAGRRTDGDTALSYVQTVRLDGPALTLEYRWLAEADTHVHMWRHQLDLPVDRYSGGTFDGGAGPSPLPVERAPEPSLAGGLRRIALTPTDGPTVTVECSGDLGLIDERHYGVPAFRLGHYPANGDLKAGETWDVALRITID